MAQLFWLALFAVALPIVIVTARASVAHILRPAGAVVADEETQSFQAVLFERGVRSLIIISAALLLARIFDIDVVSLTMRDTLGTRVLRSLISVVVIALIADFLWTLVRALIDAKLKKPLPHATTEADLGHAARLQTLLPIISNILLATIVIVAGMMILAALGVQIGPLIASAGVVGVAIGFGAQTLVKDVISGIFYLVDDAFRIGEYIQSGTYKGTVESFSLRSVKLRHQRGALYTVPFGVLGAVQNQSRDWVVDKIVMNVPYGTDLDRVRRLIKKIGLELSEDPEFGPEIISPIKMQGVAQFGDFAIQIQTKMTTKPGDVQFMARRRALLLIKQAFEANGIGFAVPTVQVSGEGQTSAAAAQGLAILSANKAAAE
jgi:moderate conductance mechanosensitive channel